MTSYNCFYRFGRNTIEENRRNQTKWIDNRYKYMYRFDKLDQQNLKKKK